MFEIEVKAKIDNKEEIIKKLKSLNFSFVKKEYQEDIYFNGIDRDFKETDEALRIRDVCGNYYLTYKGPKLDKISKSREEIEVRIEDKEKMKNILKKLGFKEVRVIKKCREIYKKDNNITVCIDDVEGLGTFIELEKEAEEYNKNDVQELLNLLELLNISKENIITKSYLEMMEYEKEK
ncbi:class IV adenylate cyclase [Methanocaldococcus indicus]|uniref:class IV adenylate cyclase n=1 Tax=Methanocaldococcus indicus TaxID=213231 RepID=UPI003C6D7209